MDRPRATHALCSSSQKCFRPAYLRIQVDAIRQFRHQRFRKSHRPPPVVIFGHRRKREPARVCCIVIRNHMPRNSKSSEEAADDVIHIVRTYLK